MKSTGRALPLLALAFAIGPAIAAEDVGAALRACRAETDDARRLACYDRVAGRAQAPAITTAEGRFGLEQAEAAEETRRRQQAARSLEELEATVTAIDTRMDGLMTITLDNGHVWRQNSPDSRFRLKEGDRVRIQPGSLNSYILSGPTKRSTRVSRVK